MKRTRDDNFAPSQHNAPGPMNKDYVRHHYNQHVNLNISGHEAIRRRRQGDALPLKEFHNEIKRQLISRFAFNAERLLDFCCGRGGDIRKWNDAKVHYAKGVDIAEGEVLEAIKRFDELQARCPRTQLFCEFEANAELGEKPYYSSDGLPYDVVTCMFALHYFFDSEQRLRRFIRNVADNLKPGGYFIATCPDGKRVLHWLHSQDPQGGEFKSPMLTLKRMWQDNAHEVQPFGHQFLFALGDTVTQGAGASQGSVEYLTFCTPITRIAAYYRLAPVYDFGDDAQHLNGLFEDEDRYEPFKHFRPYFPNSHESLGIGSSLNMAFVFRKLHPDEPHPGLAAPLPDGDVNGQYVGPYADPEQQQQEGGYAEGGDGEAQGGYAEGGYQEAGQQDGGAAGDYEHGSGGGVYHGHYSPTYGGPPPPPHAPPEGHPYPQHAHQDVQYAEDVESEDSRGSGRR